MLFSLQTFFYRTFLVLSILVFIFIFSPNVAFGQNTLSDIQEKIGQSLFWEAKKDIDELIPMVLLDSLSAKTTAFLTKGMVYDALVRESSTSQDLFLEEAVSAYKKVIKIADTSEHENINQAKIRFEALYAFLYNRAVVAHEAKDFEKAIIYYKMTLRLKNDQIPVWKNFLSVAWTSKNLQLTKTILYELMRLEQKSATYFKTLIHIVGETEQNYHKAIKICEEAQLHYPMDTTFLFTRVNYLVKQNAFDDALNLLTPLSEQNNPAILSNLAFLNRKIGKLYEAEKYWKKIYERNPTDLQPIYNIGEMFFNQGINYLKQTSKYEIETTPNKYFELALPYLKKIHQAKPKDEKIKTAYQRANIEAKQPLKRIRKKDKIAPLSVPTILLTAPSFETDTFSTENKFIKLEGLLIDEDGGAETVVNGIIGTVENDRFSIILPLKEGLNRVEITGVNFDGVKTEKTVFVNRIDKDTELRNFLILFGTDNYQNQTAETGNMANLYQLDSVLNTSFEGFSRLNTYQLLDKNATKENLMNTIRELSRLVSVNDNVILVFAGKSHHISPNNETFLQTYTCQEQATDLPISFVTELLKAVPAQNQLIIHEGILEKAFLNNAQRANHIKYENFSSRKTLSLAKKTFDTQLLRSIIDLLNDEKTTSLTGFDMFFQANLSNPNLLEFQYLAYDKEEGGDLVLKRRR